MGMSESMDNVGQHKVTTAKEMVTILREFFNAPESPFDTNTFRLQHEQRKLWDILSALRGPDSGIESEKYATTSIIRRAVLGDTSEAKTFAIFARDDAGHAETRRKLSKQYADKWNHFTSHVMSAFAALGLKWDEVNNDGQ